MVLVYNEKIAKDILSALQENKVISLDIYLDTSLGEDVAQYVFKYVGLSDFPIEEQQDLKQYFNDKNVACVTKAIMSLTKFIEMMSMDAVIYYEYHFDIRQGALHEKYNFKKPSIEVDKPEIEITPAQRYKQIIEELKMLFNDFGINDAKTNSYTKVPNPNGGKRPKYEQQTYRILLERLEEVALNEHGNKDK